jgi:hypothetical protein
MRSADLAAVFGLLESDPIPKPTGATKTQYILDSLTVEEKTDGCVYTCKCQRSLPLYLSLKDSKRIRPPLGIFACSICLNELRNARGSSDQVAVWFAQNRLALTDNQHFYLPKPLQRLVDRTEGVIMRPRRFVYAKFYGVSLNKSDKILTTCGDVNCVNPYHLMIATSPATKITPQMKEDVRLWLAKSTNSKVIRELLQTKYNLSISLKTITNLKKSLLA